MAAVAPKNTMLSAAVVLKFVPVMVTVVPTGPLVGLKDVMVGWAITTPSSKQKPKVRIYLIVLKFFIV